MTHNTQEKSFTDTPLAEIIKRVDFRTHFQENEELKRDNHGSIRMVCPSCGNQEKCYIYSNNAFCFRCSKRWGMYGWLTEVEGMDRLTAVDRLKELSGETVLHVDRGIRLPKYQEPDAETKKKFLQIACEANDNINENHIEWWNGRGVSKKAIDKFCLGFRNGWYVIPCADEEVGFYSIKKRWGGPIETSPIKKRYWVEEGSKTTYAPWILRGLGEQFAVIVGGEIKALALWSYFQEHNIPWSVITVASGEHPWHSRWNMFARFAKIAVWPDKDEKGILFARSLQRTFRPDIPVIMPRNSQAKAVDDFILEGGDPIAEILAVAPFLRLNNERI